MTDFVPSIALRKSLLGVEQSTTEAQPLSSNLIQNFGRWSRQLALHQMRMQSIGAVLSGAKQQRQEGCKRQQVVQQQESQQQLGLKESQQQLLVLLALKQKKDLLKQKKEKQISVNIDRVIAKSCLRRCFRRQRVQKGAARVPIITIDVFSGPISQYLEQEASSTESRVVHQSMRFSNSNKNIGRRDSSSCQRIISYLVATNCKRAMFSPTEQQSSIQSFC